MAPHEFTAVEWAAYLDRVHAFRLLSICTEEARDAAAAHAHAVAEETGRNHGDQAYLAALWDLIDHYEHRTELVRRLDRAIRARGESGHNIFAVE